MKKIINEKKYNTETAKIVAHWDNNLPRNDFGYLDETLYKKKTGEFFLCSEGGAMTSCAKSCGLNSWCGGELIAPMTINEARNWAEHHLNADEYEKIFGEVEEKYN